LNALQAKARQERFAALVEGDPIGRTSFTSSGSALDTVLAGRQSVMLDQLVKALANLDRNRIEHHLLARGYTPSDADPNLFERRPWYLFPWPPADGGAR
jgi:hypothetical protein